MVGTSMAEIAKAANVNKSLLYHYFATKEELWKTCKENILQTTQNINFAIPTNQGLRAFLEALIMSRYQLYEKNPDLTRMIAWQHLADSSEELQGTGSISIMQWQVAIKKLQKQGVIKSTLSPKFIITFLLSSMLLVTTQYLQSILKTASEREAYIKMLIDHLETYLAD
jgi:AcrR family transcriptional regulator